MSTTESTYERILAGVSLASDDAAIRIESSYDPIAGPGTRVFPPTYPFVEKPAKPKRGEMKDFYAVEERYLDGERRRVVAIDSFQSQANRCETALLDAIEDGVLGLPYLDLRADIDGTRVRVTSLEAPHRGPDAYFRDSETEDGTTFDDTVIGKALRAADARAATAYFQYVPTDLIYGFWDSQRGGRGVRLARFYTSEMIGIEPEQGDRAAVRVDPNNIEKQPITYPKKQPHLWEPMVDDRKPSGWEQKKPSNVGHGSVPSTDGVNSGVSVRAITRTAVVSFAAVSRLRFPMGDDIRDATRDGAARVVLVALALVADRLAFDRASIFLRSGCDLVTKASSLSWIGRGGRHEPFDLDLPRALLLLELAQRRCAVFGLSWATEPFPLQPKENLRGLLKQTFAAPPEDDDKG